MTLKLYCEIIDGLGLNMSRHWCKLYYEDLLAVYGEPVRHYHTMKHIDHGLLVMENIGYKCSSKKRAAFMFAWLYHDFIHENGGLFNEVKSANYAAKFFSLYDPKSQMVNMVMDLIKSTTHNHVGCDVHTRLFQDIDLAILGENKRRFNDYWVKTAYDYEKTHKRYYSGRYHYILKLMRRPRIYTSGYSFFDVYEERARLNLVSGIYCTVTNLLEDDRY